MTFARFSLKVIGMAIVAVLAGCGGSERSLVALGEAPQARKAAFAVAVARACAGFEGLGESEVKFEVTTNAPGCAITVSSDKMAPPDLQKALSVALTNLSLEYPGLGFMLNDDRKWSILMPDTIKIPESGAFGIGSE